MNGKRKGWFKKKGAGGEIVAGATVNLDAGDASSYPGSGTTWFDLSGNGYNATLVNGVGYDSGNSGVLTFDGINDYVLGNATPQILGNQPFTIEVWWDTSVIPTGTSAFPNIVLCKTDGSYTFGLAITPTGQSVGYGTMTFGNQDSNWARMKVSDSIYINTWYQIIITFDGVDKNNIPSYKFYINNVSKIISATGGAYGGNANVSKIGSGNAGDTYFTGKIPIVNLYLNKEFNQTEVTQNFDFYKSRFGL